MTRLAAMKVLNLEDNQNFEAMIDVINENTAKPIFEAIDIFIFAYPSFMVE